MTENIYKITLIIAVVVFVGFFGFSSIYFSSYFKNQISVTGSAKKDINNQIAEFTVTFTTENKDKSTAEEQNNNKVKKFLDDVKKFEIPEADIITDSLNVYQKQEESWSEKENRNKWKYTDWVFSQSIKVKLRDISKVNDFTNLASRNETSNISGPNFSVDTKNIDETEVYNLAFENAKKKAEGIANQSGRTLGKALYISENSYSSYPYLPLARTMGGGGASAELPSGSTEVLKSLNVVFELR